MLSIQSHNDTHMHGETYTHKANRSLAGHSEETGCYTLDLEDLLNAPVSRAWAPVHGGLGSWWKLQYVCLQGRS